MLKNKNKHREVVSGKYFNLRNDKEKNCEIKIRLPLASFLCEKEKSPFLFPLMKTSIELISSSSK